MAAAQKQVMNIQELETGYSKWAMKAPASTLSHPVGHSDKGEGQGQPSVCALFQPCL